MKYRIISITLLFFSLILLSISCSSNETTISKDTFRGVVLYSSDIRSLESDKLIDILERAKINLIGLHSNTLTENLDSLKIFLKSPNGQLLIDLCKKNKIEVEYECHVLQEILPRSLFNNHPEYFRVDTNGVRRGDLNMCFSSEEAWFVVERNTTELLKWIQPTTNRYFFWIDDSYDGFCHCDKCNLYSPSDQALLYENRMLKIIQKVNPKASLAHLAYASTLEAPKTIKPKEGIFLEFAPIGRNYEDSLSSKQHKALKKNLEIFPKRTAHVLEYWLDASMFSGWDRNKWNKVPWNANYCKRDIELYRSLGICSFTTFATWMLHQHYFELYGQDETVEILKEYGSLLNGD